MKKFSKWIGIGLLVAAAALAAYGALAQSAGTNLPGCGPDGGCSEVLSSRWATLFGLPVGWFAVPLYLAVAALALPGGPVSKPRRTGVRFGSWLVIAAAVVTPETAQALVQAGVMDSKRIRDDRKIAALAQTIRQRLGDSTAVVPIGPEAYNRLYGDFQNVNRLLAWGHARALEDVLEKHPGCPRALSDQFGNKTTVERALMTRGRGIKLEQRTKAESDVAVAAASILARHEFVRRLERLGKDVGATLPKGANPHVKQVAVDLVHRYGPDVLRKVAKTHFKTHAQVLDAARK